MSYKTQLFPVLVFALIISIFPSHSASANPNSHIERIVRSAFSDKPVMISIAKCESGFRQFNSDGSVLKGGAGKHYVGIFQIDENIHTAKAKSMGFDINTMEGNIGYAYHMYSVSGSRPWNSCVPDDTSPTPPPAPTNPQSTNPTPEPIPSPTQPMPSGSLTVNLNLGMSHPQVLLLQKILNSKGYVIAASGPGSVGNETSYFGSLTMEAVRKFQCSQGIACSGNESTTGYGRVGPITRSALVK